MPSNHSADRHLSRPARLFVYGTLAPGKPNAHVLAPLEGTWRPGSIIGSLHQEGWGATLGFPAVRLGGEDKVNGLLFEAEGLEDFWPQLDEFEGDAYRRTKVTVSLDDGSRETAYVYSLNE